MGSDTFYDYELIVCLFRLAQVSNASPRGLASQGLNERVSAGFQPLSRASLYHQQVGERAKTVLRHDTDEELAVVACNSGCRL